MLFRRVFYFLIFFQLQLYSMLFSISFQVYILFVIIFIFNFGYLVCPLPCLTTFRMSALPPIWLNMCAVQNQLLKQFFRVFYLQWYLCYHRWDYWLFYLMEKILLNNYFFWPETNSCLLPKCRDILKRNK